MSAGQVLGNGNPSGTTLTASASEKASAYGVTPVVQAAAAVAAVTAGSTTTVCNTAVAELQAVIANFGLMAAS